MKRAVFSGAVVIAMMFALQVSAWAVNMGIITGGAKGTYYQFGLNLAQLVAPAGIKLEVYPSNGSVENIFAVYKRPKTQLGIVQSDVLAFVAKVQTDPVLKRIARKIKMVFPLYNEEIHIVGRRGITDFDDLAGKRVAIGQEGSGTYLTAKLLFEVSGVKPAEQVSIGTEEALDALKKGRVDAMFYVAGYPVKLFVENVSAHDGLVLVPIGDKRVLDFYPHSEIPANTYAWQPQKVGTAAVKAVLISFDFRMANCENVGKFARILAQNMAWLKKNGHPKWRSVDLNYPLKGWQQYDCVQKFLNKTPPVPKAPPATLNPVLKAIKQML